MNRRFGRQNIGGNSREDAFDVLVKKEIEEAKKKNVTISKDLIEKVDSLAEEIEKDENKFSDLDLIYEKKQKLQ